MNGLLLCVALCLGLSVGSAFDSNSPQLALPRVRPATCTSLSGPFCKEINGRSAPSLLAWTSKDKLRPPSTTKAHTETALALAKMLQGAFSSVETQTVEDEDGEDMVVITIQLDTAGKKKLGGDETDTDVVATSGGSVKTTTSDEALGEDNDDDDFTLDFDSMSAAQLEALISALRELSGVKDDGDDDAKVSGPRGTDASAASHKASLGSPHRAAPSKRADAGSGGGGMRPPPASAARPSPAPSKSKGADAGGHRVSPWGAQATPSKLPLPKTWTAPKATPSATGPQQQRQQQPRPGAPPTRGGDATRTQPAARQGRASPSEAPQKSSAEAPPRKPKARYP